MLLALTAILGLLYFVGPWIAAPILRHKLEAMVAKSLNARLTMDGLSYDFPYGLRARNAALIAKDERGQDVDLIRVKHLELVLAKMPWGNGPLVIERIIVDEPSLRLIVAENGQVDGRDLVTEEAKERQRERRAGKEKPSDYFRLRRFEIRGGQISYEDRRRGRSGRPIVWKNLGIEMNTVPSSGSLYTYDIVARNVPLAVANVRGRIDIDTLMLDVEKFVLSLDVERGKRQEQLPPALAEVLQRYQVAGGLSISGTAHVPLRQTSQGRYDAMLDLPSATAHLAEGEGSPDRLKLKLHVATQVQEVATREVERAVTLSHSDMAATQPSARPASAPAPKWMRQPPILVKLDLLEVGAGDTVLRLEQGEAMIDPATDQWRVKDLLCRLELGKDRSGFPRAIEQAPQRLDLSGKMKLTATASGPLRPAAGKRLMDQIDFQLMGDPRDVIVKLPRWNAPFTSVSGTVRASRDCIVLENVEGLYHQDKYFLASARIPLENIENVLRIEEITGSAQLSGKVEDYPRGFEFIAKQIHPSGTWYAIGSYARPKGLPPGQRPDYRFDIRSDQAGAAVTARGIPLTDVKAEIVATDKLVEVKRLEAAALGGTITSEGQATVGRGRELMYQGNVWLRDIDLKTLAKYVEIKGKRPSKLSGKGNANVQFNGSGADETRSAADNFHASGRFEALEGDFWTVPVIDEIAGSTRTSQEALTVGQAAGVFEIHDQMVDLKQAALNSPVLGIQGDGKVAFSGRLDLHVVAAPLADWKEQFKRTKIPIVSDVAGEIFGAAQKMLNSASKTLLYEFRVHGTTKEPKIETVPAPVLTQGVAKVFGAMMKGEKLSDLLGNGQQK
jgi:hypothetical protein